MSLAHDLQEALAEASAAKCGTCAWYGTLSKEDRSAFDAFAANPDTSIAELHGVCRNNGLTLAKTTFASHMREHHGR